MNVDTNKTEKEAFLKELSELLTKYNAEISCDLGGEGYSIDPKMEIYFGHATIHTNSGCSLDLN